MSTTRVSVNSDSERPRIDIPPSHARRPLDGPVLADLAAESTPGIAALDARWAAAVLAGWTVAGYEGPDPAPVRAVRVAALRDLLEACGLIPGPWPRPVRRRNLP